MAIQAKTSYHAVDSAQVLTLYAVNFALLLLEGRLYLTTLSTSLLDALNLFFPLLSLLLCLIFLRLTHKRPDSVGLTIQGFVPSLLLGGLLAFVLVIINIGSQSIFSGNSVRFHPLSLFTLISVAIGALEEEITFRGLLRTRLSGWFRSNAVCSLVTGFLFLLIHYPVRWASAGFSLHVLSAFHILLLILLHFVCDFVYQRTNCLWGSIFLHFVYNLACTLFPVI